MNPAVLAVALWVIWGASCFFVGFMWARIHNVGRDIREIEELRKEVELLARVTAAVKPHRDAVWTRRDN